MPIYIHHPGYDQARAKVQAQSVVEDLDLIDALFGRSELAYGATPEDVKAEALRQLEIEWRAGKSDWSDVADAIARATR